MGSPVVRPEPVADDCRGLTKRRPGGSAIDKSVARARARGRGGTRNAKPIRSMSVNGPSTDRRTALEIKKIIILFIFSTATHTHTPSHFSGSLVREMESQRKTMVLNEKVDLITTLFFRFVKHNKVLGFVGTFRQKKRGRFTVSSQKSMAISAPNSLRVCCCFFLHPRRF